MESFQDRMRGVDTTHIGVIQGARDVLHWDPLWRIDKFQDPNDHISDAARSGAPMSVLLRDYKKAYRGKLIRRGNLLLNSGINVAWGLVCGAGGTAFNNANATIAVGDSSTAAVATQTGIQAATNKLYKAMDATYPLAAAAQAEVWRSTFITTDANWVWNEITVSNASDYTHALNRLVSSMGTKASGATWVVSLTITLS